MSYTPNDHYARKAKAESYLARSVYKLQEINQKHHLLHKNATVLDLGASPGSWSQYASQQIGPGGRLLGVDLTPITLQLPNATFVQGDMLQLDLAPLLLQAGITPPVHVVLSDMAPATTGIRITDQARSYELCQAALAVAQRYLKAGGGFVCKMFDGEDFTPFRGALQQSFASVKVLRPQSTRKESKELFFIAQGFGGGKNTL